MAWERTQRKPRGTDFQIYSIIGNICSGKTTLAQAISKTKNIPYFSIDEYRLKHNAVDAKGEAAAWQAMINDISEQQTSIVESTGVSSRIKDLYLQSDKVIIIKLNAPIDTLIKRLKQRESDGYIPIPFYYSEGPPTEATIMEIDYRLQDVHADRQFDTSLYMTEEIVNAIFPKKENRQRTDFQYNQKRWTKASLRFRRANPLCVECLKEGKVTEAQCTDHTIPIATGIDPWDETNWQPLCKRHHSRKTIMEMHGIGG